MNIKNNIETSIIIRTRNEGAYLHKLLDLILKQSYKDYEIIIVDSGSDDNTLEIASNYPVKVLRIDPDDFSFGRSLNVGCEAAKGDYLVFISAHSYPTDNHWLANLIKPFEDPRIAMVYGRQIGDEITKVSEERDFKNNFGTKSKILVEESFGNNANAAIRRSLWESVPFDEKLPALEDIDWAHKVQNKGFYVYYKADAVIHHIHAETYRQVYRRFRREAIAYKMIFPDHDYNYAKAVLVCFLMVIMDVYYGLSRKKAMRKVFSPFIYRFFTLKALHDGNCQVEKCDKGPKPGLAFPQKNLRVVVSDPGRHQLEEQEMPSLAADDVLIRVCYVGVCSTDLEVAAGGLDYYKSGWAKYPIVPGHEFSGVVAAKGSRVERLKIGDKVVGECILGCGECDYCLRDMPLRCQQRKELGVLNFDGAYSKYLTMPERFVHCLPAHTQLSLACLIEPLAVSLKGIGKLVAGDNGTFKKVAILGYGTIGNLCAQIMCGRGHSVVVFDKNELRVANIKNKRIKGNTQIRGLGDFDYIVEATGQVEVLKQALSETKAGAKLLLLGLPYASLDFNFESVVSFDKTLIGSLGSSREDFLAAIKNHSTLEFEGLARDIFPLKDYALAWAKQKEGKVAKAIIKIGET